MNQLRCPHCLKQFAVESEPSAAKQVCPACQTEFRATADSELWGAATQNSSGSPAPTASPSVSNETNIMRKGNLLVVPVVDSRFPNRCVKTNRKVAGADFPLVLDLIASQKVPNAVGGAMNVGSAVAGVAGATAVGVVGIGVMLATKKRLNAKIGLCFERQAKMRRLFRIGVTLMCLSPVILALPAIYESNGQRISGTLALSAGASCLLLLITGAILFGISSFGTLTVKSHDELYAYLLGANEDFLNSLPEYVPQQATPATQ